MDGLSPASLHLWRGEAVASESGGDLPETLLASQLVAAETMRPPGNRPADAEPFTAQWFLRLEERRYARHGAWLPRLMEFDKHPGEQLLAFGDGLGTDWARYARHGTHVTVCGSSSAQLAAVRRNFEFRGLDATFANATADRWPVEPSSMDVVHLAGPNLGSFDSQSLVEEIYRVLKPGGKLIALLLSRRDARYWQSVFMPWKREFAEQPAGERWTNSSVRRAFSRFSEHRVYQRHLRRSELPHLWRWMPLPVMERVMGRFLVLKTFKPISAAMSVTCAA